MPHVTDYMGTSQFDEAPSEDMDHGFGQDTSRETGWPYPKKTTVKEGEVPPWLAWREFIVPVGNIRQYFEFNVPTLRMVDNKPEHTSRRFVLPAEIRLDFKELTLSGIHTGIHDPAVLAYLCFWEEWFLPSTREYVKQMQATGADQKSLNKELRGRVFANYNFGPRRPSYVGPVLHATGARIWPFKSQTVSMEGTRMFNRNSLDFEDGIADYLAKVATSGHCKFPLGLTAFELSAKETIRADKYLVYEPKAHALSQLQVPAAFRMQLGKSGDYFAPAIVHPDDAKTEYEYLKAFFALGPSERRTFRRSAPVRHYPDDNGRAVMISKSDIPAVFEVNFMEAARISTDQLRGWQKIHESLSFFYSQPMNQFRMTGGYKYTDAKTKAWVPVAADVVQKLAVLRSDHAVGYLAGGQFVPAGTPGAEEVKIEFVKGFMHENPINPYHSGKNGATFGNDQRHVTELARKYSIPVVGDPVPRALWESSNLPPAVAAAQPTTPQPVAPPAEPGIVKMPWE